MPFCTESYAGRVEPLFHFPGICNKIIAILKSYPQVTQGEVADKVKVSVPTVKRTMKMLSDSGRIVRKGGRRYGYWDVNE